jgi:hypothetical protein
MGPARIPCRFAGLGREHVHDAVKWPVSGAGKRPEHLGYPTYDGAGEVGGEQHRYERDSCGGKRPFEHRHLDHQSADPVRGLCRHEEADVASERDSPDHGLVDPQVIEQCDNMSGVGVHPMK